MRPTCPTCGKPIPKLTTTVWVKPADTPEQYRRVNDGRWSRSIFTDNPPRSRAEAQKLSNQLVQSVRYHWDTQNKPRTIATFTEWDGESYWSNGFPFCKPECAVTFARAAHKAGYRLK